MQRRSSARRVPRKRYDVDAFDDLEELDEVNGSDDDLRRRKHQKEVHIDQESEDDFSIVPGGDNEQHDDDENDRNDANEEMAMEASSSGSGESDDSDNSGADAENRYARKRRADPNAVRSAAGSERRFDAIFAWSTDISYRGKRFRRLYGPLNQDYKAIRDAYERWPKRTILPLHRTTSNGRHGFARSASHTGDMISRELSSGWDWYENGGGKQAFHQRQGFQIVTEAQVQTFLASTLPSPISFIHGLADEKATFATLEICRSLTTQANYASTEVPTNTPSLNGFVLYCGARVQCLAWVPNQSSAVQYLTISSLGETENETLLDASAFKPQPSVPSNIQIWGMTAREDGSIDLRDQPQLRLVLCTSWGHAKSLKWCHVPSDTLDGLGLLAGLWGDGCVRVLRVPHPNEGPNPTYILIESAAVEIRPPNTVFTCLTWLDSSHLAAGCADGHLAVVDIASALASQIDNPRPLIFTSITCTYISAIDSCYPSHPHILLSTSMDGLMSMTDLSNPVSASPTAVVHSQRVRNGGTHLVWSDFAQCAITVDDSSNIRTRPIRRFLGTVTVARAQSVATALCGSPWHPFMLVGTARGEAIAFNPVTRQTEKKAAVLQQNWLTHEWRPPTRTEQIKANVGVGTESAGHDLNDPENENAPHQCALEHAADIARFGLSRLLYNFAPENVSLLAPEQDRGAGAVFSTIYEEKSAVTALSWNPNMHVAGWAAAGMGDGMIRIQDLAR